jgi:hypothetical protein
MTIKDFYSKYNKEDAWFFLQREPAKTIVVNAKQLIVKDNMNHLTYGQFVALTDLIENENTCFDLIRAFILVFHWEELTDKVFSTSDYKDKLSLIDNAEALLIYPVARKYRKIIMKRLSIHLKVLNYKGKTEYKQAGIDKFNKFGMYNACRAVGVALGFDPDIVATWNYHKVFIELSYQKTENEFQERLHTIMSKKSD